VTNANHTVSAATIALHYTISKIAMKMAELS